MAKASSQDKPKAPRKKAAASKASASKAPARAADAVDPKTVEAPKARKKAPARPKATVRATSDRRDEAVRERGDIFFFYRPGQEATPTGLADVRRFHMVLRPEGSETTRILTVGRKALPDMHQEGKSHWGFVDRVVGAPEEARDFLGGSAEEEPGTSPAARPVGEGVYALVRAGRNSVLAYALELPAEIGEAQAAFGIEKEGKLIISMKNPDAGSPNGLGLDDERVVAFPDHLRERFGNLRWTPADPPEFLDHEGAEFVLIGGREEAAHLGVDLDPQEEDEESSEVFNDLHLDRSDRAIRPLFEGQWA